MMPPFKAIRDPFDPDGRQMRRYEREFEDAMIHALSQLRRDIEQGITDDNVQDMPARFSDPDIVQPFQTAVIDALTVVAHAGVEHGRQTVEREIMGIKTLEFGVWDLANTAAAEWAISFGRNLTGMMLRLTSERIQIAVSQYILTRGQTIGQLINVIRNGYHYSPERARAIAVTEVTRAYARGNVEAWRASGVVSEKQVRTNNDEKVCPICGGKSNRVYALDDPDGDPPFHTKCRCWIVPKVV